MDQAGKPQADPPDRHRPRWSAVGGRRDVRGAGARDAPRRDDQLQDWTLARLVQVDLSLAPYSVSELVGDLADPPSQTASSRRPRAHRGGPEDPYRRIAPPEYFAKLAGVVVPRSGYVLCPSSQHTEKTASCRVWPDRAGGWWCFGCGAGGAIYDLASLVLGGPTGQALAGDAFKAAKELVVDRFGQVR